MSKSAGGTALLGKACDVLEAIGVEPNGLTQAELADRLGMPRATLYRILSALVQRGMLRQDERQKVYRAGYRLVEIAQQASQAPDLPSIAAPELRALRDITGETAYVAVLDGQEVVSLGKSEGAHEVRSAARLGQRKPLHCTSQGKAILAFLPEADRAALLRRIKLPILTTQTIATKQQLAAVLDIIRVRGFAIDDEEIVEGIRCVGAPVLDPENKVVGAISVAGPAWRMTLERAELLGGEIAAAGRRIGACLRPPPVPAVGVRAMMGPPAFHGVTPCWSVTEQCLWWADALAPEVRCSGLDGRRTTSIRWEAPLRGIVMVRGGLLVLDTTGRSSTVSPQGARRPGPTMPDDLSPLAMVTHNDGSVWVSLGRDQSSQIGLLRADGSFSPEWRLNSPVSALAWSPRGDALFAASTETGTLYRLEPGRAAARVLARLPGGGGAPAALAVDAGGQVWVALRGGWSIARLSHDGEVERVVPIPVPRPTGLAFGGPSLRTLFVTTARDGLGMDVLASAPLCGQLLMLDVDVDGCVPSVADGF